MSCCSRRVRSFTKRSESLNVHSVHGPVINPFQHQSSVVDWDACERCSAGGSSGGSGAATREKAWELCSEQWQNGRLWLGALRNLRIGIPQVRLQYASLSPFDLLTPSKYTVIFSGFAQQFHHICLPPHRSSPQGSRCDGVPRFPPKYQLRPERVLCRRQHRGEQQPRALRRRPVWVARLPAARLYSPITG